MDCSGDITARATNGSAPGLGVARVVLRPPFLLCVAILASSLVLVGPVTRYLRVVLVKEALPLRAELSTIKKVLLAPYRLVKAQELEAAVLNAMGTDQYISWILEDTQVRRSRSPRRIVHVLVTYYTGKPDLVPHTPDVCYLGAGYQPLGAENLTIRCPRLGPEHEEVPVRVVTFKKTALWEHDEPTVVYTFHCNGRFAATREEVRLRLATDIRSKHAYYSKVEVTFGSPAAKPRNLSRKDSIVAAEAFLRRLLPVLVRKHWPDWAAAEAGARSAAQAS